MTDPIPWCRTCGYRADQCAAIQNRHGHDHQYDGPPWTPPTKPTHRPGRRTPHPPGGYPRPYKD